MKKEEPTKVSSLIAPNISVDAYNIFNRLTKTLASDVQQFLILSPAHDISSNHLQIVVHMVKVVGTFHKKIEVWATITDTQYNSHQAKILTITVTKQNVLQIRREMITPEEHQFQISVTQYNQLRDIICTQAMTLLLDMPVSQQTL